MRRRATRATEDRTNDDWLDAVISDPKQLTVLVQIHNNQSDVMKSCIRNEEGRWHASIRAVAALSLADVVCSLYDRWSDLVDELRGMLHEVISFLMSAKMCI